MGQVVPFLTSPLQVQQPGTGGYTYPTNPSVLKFSLWITGLTCAADVAAQVLEVIAAELELKLPGGTVPWCQKDERWTTQACSRAKRTALYTCLGPCFGVFVSFWNWGLDKYVPLCSGKGPSILWEEFRMHLGLEPRYRLCRVKRSPIVRSKLPRKGRGAQAKSKVAAKKLPRRETIAIVSWCMPYPMPFEGLGYRTLLGSGPPE